jgi:hypothetical protein
MNLIHDNATCTTRPVSAARMLTINEQRNTKSIVRVPPGIWYGACVVVLIATLATHLQPSPELSSLNSLLLFIGMSLCAVALANIVWAVTYSRARLYRGRRYVLLARISRVLGQREAVLAFTHKAAAAIGLAVENTEDCDQKLDALDQHLRIEGFREPRWYAWLACGALAVSITMVLAAPAISVGRGFSHEWSIPSSITILCAVALSAVSGRFIRFRLRLGAARSFCLVAIDDRTAQNDQHASAREDSPLDEGPIAFRATIYSDFIRINITTDDELPPQITISFSGIRVDGVPRNKVSALIAAVEPFADLIVATARTDGRHPELEDYRGRLPHFRRWTLSSSRCIVNGAFTRVVMDDLALYRLRYLLEHLPRREEAEWALNNTSTEFQEGRFTRQSQIAFLLGAIGGILSQFPSFRTAGWFFLAGTMLEIAPRFLHPLRRANGATLYLRQPRCATASRILSFHAILSLVLDALFVGLYTYFVLGRIWEAHGWLVMMLFGAVGVVLSRTYLANGVFRLFKWILDSEFRIVVFRHFSKEFADQNKKVVLPNVGAYGQIIAIEDTTLTHAVAGVNPDSESIIGELANLIQPSERWTRLVEGELAHADFVVFHWRGAVTNNMRWELRAARARFPPSRMIFLVGRETEQATRGAIRQLWCLSALPTPAVHIIGDSELIDYWKVRRILYHVMRSLPVSLRPGTT